MLLTGAVALLNPWLCLVPAVGTLAFLVHAWRRGVRVRARLARVVDASATRLGLIRCDRKTGPART